MRAEIRHLTTFFAVTGASAAIALAPTATAAPECTDIAPNTTHCRTEGSSQIVTSPSITANGYWTWPWGRLGLGRGW